MFFSKQLNQFFAIAEFHSLTKAAEQINITPSALSHGIHELENRIGKTLIKRSKQGMVLTPTGIKLYEELLPHYTQIKRISRQLTENRSTKKPITIKLDGLYYPPLRGKLISLAKEDKKNEFSLIDKHIDDIEKELFSEGTDLVISSLDFIFNHDDIQSINLKTEHVGLLVNKDLLAKYSSIQDLFKAEKMIQKNTELSHPLLLSVIKQLKEYDYHCSPMGLAEINDTLDFVFAGAGFSLVVASPKLIPYLEGTNTCFIPSPLPFEIFLNRKIYFKKENNKNLFDIAMKIKGP